MGLREKARKVKEAGVAERGNFTPTGVPKRIYEWWLQESHSKRAFQIRYGDRKENFCHFWRVVVFWAPLRKVVYGIGKVAPYLLGLAAVAAVVCFVLACIFAPMLIVQALGFVLGLVLLVAGIVCGISAGLSPEQRRRGDWPTDKRVIALGFVLGFPTALPVFLGVRAGRYYDEHLTDYNKQVGITAAGLVLAGALVLGGLLGSWMGVLSFVLWALGFIAFAALVIVGCFYLADYVEGKRAIAKEEAAAKRAIYIAEHGEIPARQPSRFEKFFSGLGDFIILVAQVVRVKKWKFCPTVEID